MFLSDKTKKTIASVVSGYKSRRASALADLKVDENEYKEKVSALRKKTFDNFEINLAIAKNNFEKNRFKIWEAENYAEAQKIIRTLLKDSKNIVKSKTNTGREIDLEKILKEAAGENFFETDLGDFIVEIFQSEDLHYVLPALHIEPEKITEKIKEKWGDEVKPDEEELTHYLCAKIRENILKAEIGITGANFFTQSGEVILLENEGNISLISRLPKKHIIICGIDKLVDNAATAVELCQTAAIFGTGQKTAQYVSIISGPSKTADIQNKLILGAQGAREVHIMLIDNGRRKMIEDGFSDILRCINCGACINFCPVYHQIGAEYGGEKYIGSKGIVMAAFNEDLKNAEKKGSFKCTFCGNCFENCPMKINLPEMVRKIRTKQKNNNLQSEQNKEMMKKIDEFGNPFGKIDGKNPPDKLYCC